MAKLEDLIRAASERGALNHLSLTAHTERGVVTFRAAFRDTKTDGHRFGADVDPVQALIAALSQKPARAPKDETPDWDK